MGSIYLGADMGTTSAKCVAVDEAGAILALAQHPYPMQHRQQGWAEQNPEDYWNALVDVVTRCVAECRRLGHTASDVAALAMSTQGDTLIVAGSDGAPLAPAMSWMDARGEAEFRELVAETGTSFWYRETGHPLAPASSACNIRWIQRNDPHMWDRIGRFCYVDSFLTYRLTGRFAADAPSASWTPLFRPSQRGWSERVLEILGVGREAFPEVIESGQTIGCLLPEVAARLGLKPSVKLVAGAFDQAAAALGTGAMPGERAVLSCGTAWVLYCASAAPIVDDSERIPVCCHTSLHEWGVVLPFTGGSAYDWLNRALVPDAPNTPDASGELVFVPHLYGGLCPDWQSQSKGSLLGLTMAHTPQDIRLAIMRGIAFEARRNLDAAEGIIGRIASIRMVGGAGKSAIWPRIVANALDRPVEISGCVESACYGAARLAAAEVSSGWKGFEGERLFEPSSYEVSLEQSRYERYLRFYEALLPAYQAG